MVIAAAKQNGSLAQRNITFVRDIGQQFLEIISNQTGLPRNFRSERLVAAVAHHLQQDGIVALAERFTLVTVINENDLRIN